MTRLYLGTTSPLDGSGWVTVVEFLAILGFVGVLGTDRPRVESARERFFRLLLGVMGPDAPARIALLGAIPALYMGVRIGGIAVESAVPWVSPKPIVAVFYPILAQSIPVAADRFSRDLEPRDASLHASVALGGALLLEQAYLELSVLPVGLLLHRVSLILSVGLIGAGSAIANAGGERWNELRFLGILGWVMGLVLGLVGVA